MRGIARSMRAATLATIVSVCLLGLPAPCSPCPSSAHELCGGKGALAHKDAGQHGLQGETGCHFLERMCSSARNGRQADFIGGGLEPRAVGEMLSPQRLRDRCGHMKATGSMTMKGFENGRVTNSLELRGGGDGQGTEEIRKGLENVDNVEDDGNQTKPPCNTDGGCPHGRHSDNPDEQHCMECEVMAFLQVNMR